MNYAVKTWKQDVARILDERRPDRYVVDEKIVEGEELMMEDAQPYEFDASDVATTDWLDGVVDDVAGMLPEEEVQVRQVFARGVVAQIEGTACRAANREIRRLYDERQLNLAWLDNVNLPLSIETREPVWGGQNRVRVRTTRVRLGAMTDADFDAFEIAERRRASREFRTRNDTCDAAQWIAEQMRGAKAKSFRAWVEDSAPRIADTAHG